MADLILPDQPDAEPAAEPERWHVDTPINSEPGKKAIVRRRYIDDGSEVYFGIMTLTNQGHPPAVAKEPFPIEAFTDAGAIEGFDAAFAEAQPRLLEKFKADLHAAIAKASTPKVLPAGPIPIRRNNKARKRDSR